MNSFTIVVPIIYSYKTKYGKIDDFVFSKLHRIGAGKSSEWEKFSDNVFSQLREVDFSGAFEWKKVNLTEQEECECIDSVIAFGGQEYFEELEKDYFYKEMFDTLYDKKGTASCLFMLTANENKVEFENEIVLKDDLNNSERYVQKVYFYLTNADIGLLIIEGKLDDVVVPANSCSKLLIKGKSVVEYFLGEGKSEDGDKIFGFPYNDKCFIAEYVVDEGYGCGNTDSLDIQLDNVGIIVSNFKLKGIGKGEGLVDFFAHYFQIFWLCILQKTEILHVSQRAGRISRNKSTHKMRDEIQRVNEEYTLFCNQYDLVECTYDEDGEKLYSILREKMFINRNKQDVGEQVNALKQYAELISGKWNTVWLAFVSVVCSICSLVEFVMNIYKDKSTFFETHWEKILIGVVVILIVLAVYGVIIFRNHNRED